MKYSRLSTYKIKKIIVNTINSYYNDFRRKIFKYLIKNNNKNTKSLGEFELDAKRKKIRAKGTTYKRL